MQFVQKNKLEVLEDVFVAWIGGYPETTSEIRTFLEESRLDALLSVRDIEILLGYNAYFSAETAQAVYALMPPVLKVQKGEYALFAQTFNRINVKTSRLPRSQVIAADLRTTLLLKRQFFSDKMTYMKNNYNKLRTLNNKLLGSRYSKQKYQEQKKSRTEEEKQAYREKARLRMQKYRAEHPEKVVEQRKRLQKEKTAMQKLQELFASRQKYRNLSEEKREQIRLKRREQRAALKAENPELLKELDRQRNNHKNRAKTSHNYYERHKEEISRKARENPKVKIYKQRYKQKQRLKKTGPRLLQILQGIVNNKER